MFAKAETLHKKAALNRSIRLAKYKEKVLEELEMLMEDTCAKGLFGCTYSIRTNEPAKVQVWEEVIAPLLVQQGYRHTFIWGSQGYKHLGAIEISW